jgi:hypothetical protein
MYRISTTALSILALAAMAGTASAAALFSESFDTNDRAWTANANWQVVDGVYRFTSPTSFFSQRKSYVPFGLVSAADLAADAYTVSFDYRYLAGLVGFNVGASWEDAAGNQNWSANSKEYGNVKMQSYPVGGGITSIVGNVPNYEYSQWHHLDITIVANHVSLYRDGVKQVEGDLGTFDMDQLGFSVWNANAEFDNLVVRTGEVVHPVLNISFSHVRLCWDSIANQTYQIQYMTDDAPGTWVDSGPPIIGNGSVNCEVRELMTPRRTYRVRLVD